MGLDLSHLTPVQKNDHDDVLDYFTIEALCGFPEYLERHKQFIVEEDFEEFGKENVIHFKSIGDQRKGMSRSFYSDFKNDGIYFDKQSVKNAYNYLEADHISTLTELQENFKKNFIDNFIEGKSLFHISW